MLTYKCANALLDFLTQRSSTYAYGGLYVGLSSTAPNRDGTGYTEPSTDEYSRVKLSGMYEDDNGIEKYIMTAANLGIAENTNETHFKVVVTPWGTLTHYLLFDKKVGGTLLAYGELTEEMSPIVDTVPVIKVGDITLALE